MEALTKWLNDKKNLPIVIGIFAAVVVLVLVIFVVLPMMSGGGDSASAPGTEVGVPTPGVTPPAASPAATPAATPVSTPAPTPGAAPAADGKSASAKEPPLEIYRSDPFRPVFGDKAPKRGRILMVKNLPKQDIRQIAPVNPIGKEQTETLPAQPQRRMAGILKNGRVYAILVTEGGRTDIVRPGQSLDENVAVDRILPDRVILRSLKLKTPVYIEVPKSAGNPPPQTSAGGGGAGPASPANPNGGGGRRPGRGFRGGGGPDGPPPPAP